MTKKTTGGFRQLTTPIHFHTAKIDNDVILVFLDGELIGNGRITDVTETTVIISGEHYIIGNCTFTYLN